MLPTRLSSTMGSQAGSSLPDWLPTAGLCAIDQPNLFPRLSTLAKLFAADYWIVLDDVQFARRDYQHRARLAALGNPQQQQWLTLPTLLPRGRSTIIREPASPTRPVLSPCHAHVVAALSGQSVLDHSAIQTRRSGRRVRCHGQNGSDRGGIRRPSKWVVGRGCLQVVQGSVQHLRVSWRASRI
ncbi:WbqC family protein [Streptomyces sp. NPDC058471]|uniref:WbqC family protein n=1 Tax=Streptomyces sp. NPDC058471 TaxID=3346516 RepID=UPI0036633B93